MYTAVKRFTRPLEKLRRLPLKKAYKENAIMGILAAKWWYCPWNNYLLSMPLHIVRLGILAVVKPYLRNGARCLPAAMAICTKQHKLDPLAAPTLKLVQLLAPHWMEIRPLLCDFLNRRTRGIGPIACMAYYMQHYGMRVEGDYAIIASGERVSLVAPSPDHRQRWLHAWRALLKSAELQQRASHRRDYAGADQLVLEWESTLQLHKACKPSFERICLEMVFTGALLTPWRIDGKKNQCRHLGCSHCHAPVDDDVHRFWECPRWSVSRSLVPWKMRHSPLAPMRLAGIMSVGHTCTQVEVTLLQRHMCNVVADTIRDAGSQLSLGDAQCEMDLDDNADTRDTAAPTTQPRHAAAASPADPPSLTECQRIGSRVCTTKKNAAPPPAADKGSIFEIYVGRGGKRRIRCQRCMHTAPEDTSANFRSRHKRCGMRKSEPVRRSKAKQPKHIVLQEQKILGAENTIRRVLCCQICGGFGADTSYARFIRNHESCTTESASRRRATKMLTRKAAQVISDSLGQTAQECGRKKRLKLLDALATQA